MQSLDEPDKISKMCQEIGQKHAKYRRTKGMKVEKRDNRKSKEWEFQIDYWDKLGEAITETIREYQGWKIHRESLRAATVLVSYVVDQLRFGESISKKLKSKSVFRIFERITCTRIKRDKGGGRRGR